MTRIPYSPAAVLACLVLTASAGWSQDTTPTDPPVDAPAATEAPSTADAAPAPEAAAGDPNIAVASEEDGRYYTADGVPTYNIAEDGTVDWLTYSGFRRYHAECHVCHGPDGEGSSYAPALKNSALNLDYYDFYGIVAGGRQNVDAGHQNVMPAFGTNVNVMCYLDDIYVYLKARGTEALPRGRPAQREDKSDAIREAEETCLGT
jgi:methanol metabolism-related c-type cytochrome